MTEFEGQVLANQRTIMTALVALLEVGYGHATRRLAMLDLQNALVDTQDYFMENPYK